MKAEME